jgi:hypothetical protein
MINLIELCRLHIVNATDSLLFKRGTKEALLRGAGTILVLKIVRDWPLISVFRMTAVQLLAKLCVVNFADVNTLLNFNCVV